MGICISSQAGDIQDEKLGHGHRNDVVLHVSEGSSPMVCSLFSQQGSKGLNQDAAILHQGYGGVDGAFCGVFDGHGKNGHVVSEMVRDRLPVLLLEQKDTMCGEDEWKTAFGNAFSAMDKEMKLLDKTDCSLSGTTAVVVVKQKDDLYIANLGDSRAVMGIMTHRGIEASQLTVDLKPGLADEADRIRKWKGRVFALDEEPHIQRVWMPEEDYPGLAMSRSFGDFDLKNYGVISTPQVSHYHISSGHRFLVLATDGVWDALTNEEVVSIVSGARTGEAAAREVVLEARKAWKRRFPSAKIDDCTALCLFFD